MFEYYDKNGDGYLDSEELRDVERHDYLRPVFETTSCHMRDFIILQDTNDDRRLSLAELNLAMGTSHPLCPYILLSSLSVKRPSAVRLSVPSINSSSGMHRICCLAPSGQEISIDCRAMGAVQQTQTLCSSGAAARRSAANADSVKLTADV